MQNRKGKDIELIPNDTAKIGLDFEHPVGISSSFWLESQGDYHVLSDPENANKKVGDYDIFNFKAAYQLQKATIGFEVKNVFDEEYYAYVWNLGNGFQPGDGRSYYAWMTFEY
jgi:iron complex outermembrane receptor protein